MKRYLLFAGSYYYPRGGWRDKHGEYDTIELARAAARLFLYAWPELAGEGWYHVVDADTRQVVAASKVTRSFNGQNLWEDDSLAKPSVWIGRIEADGTVTPPPAPAEPSENRLAPDDARPAPVPEG